MNVKEAVAIDTKHVLELFEAEQVSNVGLEEVELDTEYYEPSIAFDYSRLGLVLNGCGSRGCQLQLPEARSVIAAFSR